MKNKHNYSAIALALSVAFIATGCGESTSSSAGSDFNNQPTNETEFNEQALITNLADNVIAPTFSEFKSLADAQQEAVLNYCQLETAFAQGQGDPQSVMDAKSAAQETWKASVNVWQQAELMQIGPLLENDSTLRNNVYSWPIVNSCAVDFDVMFYRGGTVNGAPYDITKRTPSRKGMAALEYLLFSDSLEDSCDSAGPDGWNNLTDSEKLVARCEFAGEVAMDVANNAQAIVTQWTEHATAMKSAGTTGSTFSSEHEAVNRISDAMFYIDSSTKDGKLAEPLGLFTNSCGAQACPEAVESPFAHHSIEHIINNLQGFNRLLTGEDGIGFIDYLLDVGDQDTADNMSADVQAAIENAQAYQASLADTLATNPDQVQATHTNVKKVTDKLKADFINSLALELPQTSAGDND